MTHPTDFRAELQRLVNAVDAEPGAGVDATSAFFRAVERARAELSAAPQQEAPSHGEIECLAIECGLEAEESDQDDLGLTAMFWQCSNSRLLGFAYQVLTRYSAQPASVPVTDVRYEFAVYDSETGELQAGGEAPTLEEAQREGRLYFAMYSEDGPMRLELRRVEVLPLPEVRL
jgi:hypothetical protein